MHTHDMYRNSKTRPTHSQRRRTTDRSMIDRADGERNEGRRGCSRSQPPTHPSIQSSVLVSELCIGLRGGEERRVEARRGQTRGGEREKLEKV